MCFRKMTFLAPCLVALLLPLGCSEKSKDSETHSTDTDVAASDQDGGTGSPDTGSGTPTTGSGVQATDSLISVQSSDTGTGTLVPGTGSETGSGDIGTQDTGSDTDTQDSGNPGTSASDPDAGTVGSDSTDGNPLNATCQELETFASQDCGMEILPTLMVQLMCHNLDQVFNDSFMGHANDCMIQKGCDELAAMLATESEADAGAEPNAFELCLLEAAAVTEPEQAGIDFKTHYCDYMMQCDPALTVPADCEPYFAAEEMGILLALDEPYITDADACVNPMPQCGDESVQTCLENVWASAGAVISQGFE